MRLWIVWWNLASRLRPAFSRNTTFLWFAAALAGMCVRPDLAGITSFVRALGLRHSCYPSLIGMFHSKGISLDKLTALWTRTAMETMRPHLLMAAGRPVLLADGIKIPKSGRKMPGVKKLHQESDNNTKPEYIYGHSCQSITLAVKAGNSFLSVPLACRVHEGTVFSNRHKRTTLDKLMELSDDLPIGGPATLVADAFYASGKIIKSLLAKNWHLITSARTNIVARLSPEEVPAKKRGRPKKYGKSIKIYELFSDEAAFVEASIPLYCEKDVTVRFRTIDLFWQRAGVVVRFVLVIHPARGRKILMCTDLAMSAEEIIQLYGVRFKIEVGFKQAVHTLGAFAYHFWMKAMKPRPRKSGDQYLHRESKDYRDAVRLKLHAYHCHIQMGVIAQGIIQAIAIQETRLVWSLFGSWLRTIRADVPPSERVVALAMRNALPEFLADSPKTNILVKFIRGKIDVDRAEGLRLVS